MYKETYSVLDITNPYLLQLTVISRVKGQFTGISKPTPGKGIDHSKVEGTVGECKKSPLNVLKEILSVKYEATVATCRGKQNF